MSVTTDDSKQQLDATRRELQKKVEEFEALHREKARVFEERRTELTKRLKEEYDAQVEKVQFRIDAFSMYVENNHAAGVVMDDEKVQNHLDKLKEKKKQAQTRRAEYLASADVELKPYALEMQKAESDLEKARMMLTGHDEFLVAINI